MHVRYTSRDGGDKLGTAASGAVADYVKAVTDLPTGLFAVVDARSEAASKWAQFLRAGTTACRTGARVSAEQGQ